MKRREVTKTNGLSVTGATGQGVKAKPAESLTGCRVGSPLGRTSEDLPVSFQALVMALLGVEPAGSAGLSGASGNAVDGVPGEAFGTPVSSIEAVRGTAGGVGLEGMVRVSAQPRLGGLLCSLPGEFPTEELDGSETGAARSDCTQPGSGPAVTVSWTNTVSAAQTGGKLLSLSTAPGARALTRAQEGVAVDNASGGSLDAVAQVGLPAVDKLPELTRPEALGEGWGRAFRIREIPVTGSGFQARGASGEVLEFPQNSGHKVPAATTGGLAGLVPGAQTPRAIGDGQCTSTPGAMPLSDGNGAKTGGDEGANPSGEKQKTRGTSHVLPAEPGVTRTDSELAVGKTSAAPGRVASEPSLNLPESAMSHPSGEGARPKALEMQIVEPEFGKLTVLLTSRGSDLNIRFLSPDARIREVLWETRYELYDAMSGRGLNLTGFTVESGWSSDREGPAKGRDRVAGRAVTQSRLVTQADPVVALGTRSWGLVDYLV